MMYFIFQYSQMNKKKKKNVLEVGLICNIIHVFTGTFDQLNTPLNK